MRSGCWARCTCAAAQAYLEFLYTPEAQDLIGKHFYRPTSPEAVEKYKNQFAQLKLVTAAAFIGVTIPGLPQKDAEALRDTLIEVAETRRTGL